MPQIKVLKPFKFAHLGFQVEEFEPADEAIETSDECAAVAITEGWASAADVCTDNSKAVPAAPENKDAASLVATKATS